MEQVPGQSAWPRVFRMAACVLAILAYLAFLFPAPYGVADCGPDPSWQYALNAAHLAPLTFGKDILFTYGPMGYLLVPLPMGNNLFQGLLFRLIVHALWAIVLAREMVAGASWRQILLFGAAYWAAMLFRQNGAVEADYRTLDLVLLCALGVHQAAGPVRLKAVIVGVFAAILLFAKFSTGLAAMGAAGVLVLSCLLDRRPSRRLVGGIVLAAIAGTVAAVYAAFFRDPAALGRWLRGSLEIARGYGTCMSLPGPAHEVVLAAFCLIATAVTLAFVLRGNARSVGFALIVAIPLFMLFKNGFVRQDRHVMIFFSSLLALCAVLLLLFRTRRDTAALLLLYSLVLPATVYVATRQGIVPDWPTWNARGALSNLHRVVHFDAYQDSLARYGAARLARDRLPADFVAWVGRRTVDVVPWELSMIGANGFLWRPSPILQQYQPSTPLLDGWCADHYASPAAADTLLAMFDRMDGRHPLLDTPAVWRAILANYSFDRMLPSSRVLVMRRGDVPRRLAPQRLREQTISTTDWVDVPDSSRMLSASFSLRQRWYARIALLLFRLPPVGVHLLYEDGIRTYRLAPDVTSDGLLMNYLPADLDDLADLSQGRAGRKVLAFRLTGDGLPYFEPLVRIAWQEWDYPVSYTPRHERIAFTCNSLHQRTGERVSLPPPDGRTLLVARPGDKEDFLAFGNYYALPRGTYEARFWLSISDVVTTNLADLDVAGDQGRAVLGATNVTTASRLSTNAWIDVAVPFRISRRVCEDIECRVLYRGGGTVRVGGVTIVPLTEERAATP